MKHDWTLNVVIISERTFSFVIMSKMVAQKAKPN